MTETREIKGEVESWSTKPHMFNDKRGSVGLKIDGEWHNFVGSLSEMNDKQSEFPQGSIIKFSEEKNQRGYWDIKGNITKVTKQEAYTPPAHQPAQSGTNPSFSKDKEILLQCCLKTATEMTKIIMQNVKDQAIAQSGLRTMILTETEELYKGFSTLKEKLQRENKW